MIDLLRAVVLAGVVVGGLCSGAESLSPCADAVARRAVCTAANNRAVELMRAGQLQAATVMQDVRTGALLAFAASEPAELDVTTPVLPLSVAKVFLAASWWDHNDGDGGFHQMLVRGSDGAGRQLARMLRKSVGTAAVLANLERYGFGPQGRRNRDDKFWAELAPAWRTRLMPPVAYTSLTAETADTDWDETLSLGENNFIVTALHISRFLQAVGNDGVMISPVAREERAGGIAEGRTRTIRVMKESTARRLQAAMRDVVQRGTAKSVAASLEGTDWSIGGKTGSGPGQVGPTSDGWFAGLVFDAEGQARFTVATFVRRGGLGGGNAARISAELARYVAAGGRSERPPRTGGPPYD